MRFTAIIKKDEKIYVAKCPEVGTVSQGRTVASAIKNLKEATELYLEEFGKEWKNAKSKSTIIATFEVAEVAKA